MKFKKYQDGGAIYTPFISSRYTQLAQSGTSDTSSPKSSNDEVSYWDKEFVKLINQHGLQSDVDSAMMELNSIARRSQALSQTSLFGGSQPSTIMSDIILANSIINKVKSGQKMYDAASQNLTAQNAWGEAATTSTGNIYVYKDGNVTTVTPDEYAKSEGKYQYLTNSQLMGIRRESAPYQDRWTENMAGALGMDTIEKTLKDTVKDFGSTSWSEYTKRTGNNASQSVWQGMQLIIGEGPDGYYKATTKTEKANITAAINYLWDTLGVNGQAKLRAEVAIKGGNPNNSGDMYNFIAQVLNFHTDESQDVNFEKSATEYDPDGDSKGNSSGSSEVTDTLAEKYTSGSGAPPPRYEILMTSKSGVPMYAFTQDLGPILNSDGKSAKGNANLEDVFTNGYGLTTADLRSITFGDQLIDWSDVNKIVYDASTHLKRVYLPATMVNGRITPDFGLYNKISKLNDNVKEQGLNDEQIAKLVESTYPNLTFNKNTGLIEAKNTQLFFTFGAIASTDTYGRDLKNSDWRVEQSDEIDRSWKDTYNRLIGYSTNSNINEGTETGNRETGNGFMPWNWGYKFYKGNIFIPIIEPMLASTIYNDQYWSKESYRNMTQKAEAQARQEARESASNLRTGF